MDSERFRALVLKALEHGGRQTSPMRVEWDMSGSCESPKGQELELKAVGERKRFIGWQDEAAWKRQSGVVRWTRPPKDAVLPLGFSIGLTVRCRQCEPCRLYRELLWRSRAKNELASSLRTWSGTMTLRPEAHFKVLCQCRAKLFAQGLDFDALGEREQFRLRIEQISPSITKYLKRVRKNSKSPLRYLWVAEKHKSGLPHFHALVHEIGEPIRWKVLNEAWWEGFSKWKLVSSTRQGVYLCKYLNKSSEARVRSSLQYGMSSLDIAQLIDVGRDLQMSNADPQIN